MSAVEFVRGIAVKGNRYKVYCAGPLFNPKEREEMQQIASVLEGAGYRVFLPQRDGLEFARLFPYLVEKNISSQDAQKILNIAIFSLDVFQIMGSQGLLLNMNGRVPDEGAMVEAGIAWAHDKVVVIFRSDCRSLVEGNCNPMILGLSDFSFVSDYRDITTAFETAFSSATEKALLSDDPKFEATNKSGKQISDFLASEKSPGDIADLVIDLFRERICRSSEDPKESCSQASTQP